MFDGLVSVIVTSWNREEVVDCLVSISRHTDETAYEVILTDNGSDQGLQEELQKCQHCGLINRLLLRSPGDGQSWAASMNEAVLASRGTWLVVPSLANDFVVTPNWLDAMARVVRGDNARRVHWAFAVTQDGSQMQAEGFGGYVLEPARYAHDPDDDPDYTGHALLHRSLWDAVGPYDTQFEPIYMEDVDWGIRLHIYLSGEVDPVAALQHRPAIQLVPDAVLIHTKTHTVRGHGAAMWGRNRDRLLAKYPAIKQALEAQR